MGESKKKKLQRTSGIRKYNLIVSSLVKEKKRKKEPYSISEIRKYASSIYPNFKTDTYSSLKKNKGRILRVEPIEKIEKTKDEIPEYPERLTDPDQNYFFDVSQMLNALSNETSNKISFTSDIPGLEDFKMKGGDELLPNSSVFYQGTFANIVNYFNKLVNSKAIDYTDVRIVITKPKKLFGKWQSKITIVDSSGNRIGSDEFDPNLSAQLNKYDKNEVYISPPRQKEKKPSAPELKSDLEQKKQIAEIEKQERIEIEKQKTIQIALKMVSDGKMNWEQFDELMLRLYSK